MDGCSTGLRVEVDIFDKGFGSIEEALSALETRAIRSGSNNAADIERCVGPARRYLFQQVAHLREAYPRLEREVERALRGESREQSPYVSLSATLTISSGPPSLAERVLALHNRAKDVEGRVEAGQRLANEVVALRAKVAKLEQRKKRAKRRK